MGYEDLWVFARGVIAGSYGSSNFNFGRNFRLFSIMDGLVSWV